MVYVVITQGPELSCREGRQACLLRQLRNTTQQVIVESALRTPPVSSRIERSDLYLADSGSSLECLLYVLLVPHILSF